MTRPLTVLIVGGYGTFGGRLAQLLSDLNGLTLLIGGRSLERAQLVCSSVTGRARLEPGAFDRDETLEARLRQLQPHLVVDASSPFNCTAPTPTGWLRPVLLVKSTTWTSRTGPRS